MISAQFILIACLFLSLLSYFYFFQSDFRNRAILIALGVFGSYLILRPEDLTLLARNIGVGRGTDLLFYFFTLFVLFALMVFYGRLKRLEQQRTLLARELALLEEKIRTLSAKP